MEKFDADKAARVWQRVQNREEPAPQRQEPTPQRQEPGILIRMTGEQGALYRALSRCLPGRAAERMRKYYTQQQRAGDCLRGICRLNGIPAPGAGQPAFQTEEARRMLEKACHGERRLVGEYTALMGDQDWGRVYGRMAAEAAERCWGLLELLGSGE